MYAVSLMELSVSSRAHFPIVTFTRERIGEVDRLVRREAADHRPHHIHFLMAQDVAVIGVFPAEVDKLVDDRVRRVALRIDVIEHRCRAKRHHRVQRPDGVGQFERHCRDDRPQGDDGILERADPYRVLPAQLGGFGWNDDVVPGDPVHHLHVIQVEVDRVGIDAVMRDAPDLGSIGCVGDGCDFDIAHWQTVAS